MKDHEAIIVLDFKENLKLGSGPVEVGKDFFERTQVSCLGCAVHIGHTDKTFSTHYFDVLSYSLSHDGLYVREAMNLVIPLVQQLAGGTLSDLALWMDCGPHFRCFEVLHDLLIDVPECFAIPTVRINYFAEHHGKSLVDGHFGHVSRAVKQYTMSKRLVDIDDLCSAISEYFVSKDVQPLVLSVPERSTITRLTLKEGKATVKITQTYCFVAKEKKVFCSVLSAGTPLRLCQTDKNMKVDSRSTKKPPKLEERTTKVDANSDVFAGPDTTKKLKSQWQFLTATGLLT